MKNFLVEKRELYKDIAAIWEFPMKKAIFASDILNKRIVFIKFNPSTHGTNALEFLRFFENNGYKIILIDFLLRKIYVI